MNKFIESKIFLIVSVIMLYLFCFGYFFIPLQDEYNETLIYIFKNGRVLNGFMCVGIGVFWSALAFISFKTMQWLSSQKKMKF